MLIVSGSSNKTSPAMSPPRYALLFGLLFSSLQCTGLAANRSTLKAGEGLVGSEKLVSSNGKFALGFFETGHTSKFPSNAGSRNWYLGIWFNEISKFTAVWVANRDGPITESSFNQSKLTVLGDGNFVVLNRVTESVIWSSQIVVAHNRTKTSRSSSHDTTAVLLDSGNLVIHETSNPGRILWQSFDHPADVILPGGKIGRNKVTGTTYSVVSKKNSVDPASGSYCMELDHSGGKQYFDKLCNTSIVYFATGEWNGQYFPSVPEMSGNAFAAAEFVDTREEEYLTYYTFDKAVLTMCLLDSDGLTKQLVWVEALQDWETIYVQPKAPCDVFAVCGPFTVCSDNSTPLCSCMMGFSVRSPKEWNLNDRRGGCMRNAQLDCSRNKTTKESTDQFLAIPSARLPYDARAMQAVASAQDCLQVCLSNCSCTAYSFSKGACSVWQGELVNVKQYSGATDGTNGNTVLYVRLAAGEVPSLGSNGRRTRMIIGVVVGASVVGSVFLVLVLISIIQRNNWNLCGRLKIENVHKVGGIIAFRYIDLQRATKNFSEKLGEGGFGSVFKGILSDSTTVAVKTLNGSRQGEKQFRAEVSTIGMIQHVNLVKLIGFCSEGDRRMLVYEHMLNRSLDVHLFRSNAGTILNWNTRYQIAIGIAKGLSYLHESCQNCIIHCDVKPENILLDESFVPRIADFGMAKLVGRDFSRVLTTMRGTIGYLAPEWISGVAITQKVDVYSYGMVLLEIVSGRRNTLEEHTSTGGDDAVYFPVEAARKLHEGALLSLVDQQLHDGEIDMEEVERACKVACWCIQDNELDRPTMGDVVQVLLGRVEIHMPPTPRLLQTILGISSAAKEHRESFFYAIDINSNP